MSEQLVRPFFSATVSLAVAVLLAAGWGVAASAATVCVNPQGSSGCYKTIHEAVAAANPGDTVQVARGTYAEGIAITKPLFLIGQSEGNTIIDATGQANGVYVDGIDNTGLANVTVADFTVENANFEGILVANASNVTIDDNRVVHNDAAFDPATVTCPGIPAFETAEGFDCGEGIHFSGVDHSVVAGNFVANNAGGILLSDDTGATHDNLITHNTSQDNPYDCGIVLASHPPAAITGSDTPLGVFQNTVSGNTSLLNGRVMEGAGVGIFASVPGAAAYRNTVVGNHLYGNGLPGVAIHGHTPNQNLNDNVVTRNDIADNGADTDDAATPGPTGINIYSVSPVTGTVVSENFIGRESYAIAISVPDTVTLRLNRFFDRTVGVDNIGSGTVDAAMNWWGCRQGPTSHACASTEGSDVTFTPWQDDQF
jgi:hypothetical protein